MKHPELSKLFKDQCVGTHAGHMAALPNSPTIMSLCEAAGVETAFNTYKRKKFSEFLRAVADDLDELDAA